MRTKFQNCGAPGKVKAPTHRKRIATAVKTFHARRKLALELLDRLEHDGFVFLDDQPKGAR